MKKKDKGYDRSRVLEKKEADQYTISLVSHRIWKPKEPCRYGISNEISLELRLPHYEASIGVVKLTTGMDLTRSRMRRLDKQAEKGAMAYAKKQVDEQWRKLASQRTTLKALYSWFAQDAFLQQAWNLYNNGEMPQGERDEDNRVFFRQKTRRPQSVLDLVKEVEDERYELDSQLHESLSHLPGSWHGQSPDDAVEWLSRVTQNAEAYTAMVEKSKPFKEKVDKLTAELAKCPDMKGHEEWGFARKARDLFGGHIVRLLKAQDLPKKQMDFWVKLLEDSGVSMWRFEED